MYKVTFFLLLFLYPICTMGDTSSCEEVLKYLEPNDHFYVGNITSKIIQKREVEPIFLGHPKTQEEIWHQKFKIETITKVIDEADVLVRLLHKITDIYLKDCIPVIVYDKFVEAADGVILQRFFQVIHNNFFHYFGDSHVS